MLLLQLVRGIKLLSVGKLFTQTPVYIYEHRSVHSLYTISTQSVHSLYTVCTQSVHSQYTVCTQSVHNQYTACTQPVHSLYTVCTQSVQSLYTIHLPMKFTRPFPTICCLRNKKLNQTYSMPPSWYLTFYNYIYSIHPRRSSTQDMHIEQYGSQQ